MSEENTCEHQHRKVGYDRVTCQDCGSIRTDSQWGIASCKWFPDEATAKFYQQHGRLPEPVPS